MFTLNNSQLTLGIDIDSTCARVALLERKGKKISVLNLIKQERNDLPLADVLQKVKSSLKKSLPFPYTLPKLQAMAIAPRHVITKLIAPAANISDHEQHVYIGMQLAENLGLPLDELLYDYSAPSTPEQKITVYACKKIAMNESITALEQAKFHLSVLELQQSSLLRIYKRTIDDNDEKALLIDISNNYAQLLLVDPEEKSDQVFSREISLPSAQQADDALAFTELLAEEILHQYQKIKALKPSLNVSSLWVSGSNLKRLDQEMLQQSVKWDVHLFNPLQSFNTAHLPSGIVPMEWSTAIGLALREDNDASN
ncbi:MAG: type IV pilus biogenesis protein PilM [Vibrionaceae bacterium]